jgi:hypothetical protein
MLFSGDLESKPTPTGMTILTKITVPISMSLSPMEASTSAIEGRLSVVKELLDAYARNSGGDSFRAIRDGSFIHIVPLRIRAENGTAVPFDPLLGTKISFSEHHFANLNELVQMVLDEVARSRGVSIVVGEIPTNIFRQTSVVEVANNEPARDVLERAFAELNGPRLAIGLPKIGLTWNLVYDPTDRGYWFHAGAIEIDPISPGTSQASGLASKSSSNTSDVRPNAVRRDSRQ